MDIPLSEIDFSYARSSGPGGQNVNKVNSKAVLRWNLLESPSLSETMRLRLFGKLASQLTTEGELIITSDRFRDQGRNREDCLEKLRAIVHAASIPPKIRKKTKPTKGSKRRNLREKSQHSDKKKMRGKSGMDY